MPFDAQPWRADTPAALAGRIHLNNAGAALSPRPVLEAVQDHLQLEAEMGGYEAAAAAAPDVDAAYTYLARLVGAQTRNIAVVENATAAFALALSAFDFAPGDVILTTRNDYISNQLMYLALAQRRGVQVRRAADLPAGGVDPDSLRRQLEQHRPALVAMTYVPTNSGLVQPAATVGALCREAGVPFLLDACQAVGQIPLDMAELGCDFLAATARKFLRGPRGIGFLGVADTALQTDRFPLYPDMRGARWVGADRFELEPDARRFENWEFSYALLLGQGAAARYALEVDVAEAGAYAAGLADRLRQGLRAMPGVRVLDRGERLCAIVTASFPQHGADEVAARLREQAINTSVTRRAWAIIDMDDKQATSAVRFSPHYYNTEREIDITLSALEEFTEE